ncbi:MAG: FtsX-like permease family protein, partial [Capnocytophaga granulosa]
THEGEGELPLFATDLFFESIPDKYIDVQSDQWQWTPSRSFIPIIIPENYLTLYNFGFAESQGLPVLSKGLIDKLTFGLRLSGNGKEAIFSSRIVGFSAKINSILVPEDFLAWANQTYGTPSSRVSRLLVEFHDPSQQEILTYFKAHNYTISKDELELSKMRFFFSSALWTVVGIALLILLLSVAVVILSLHLVLQRNREQIRSLLSIGYTPRQIARYYQWVVCLFTLGAIIAVLVLCYLLRNLYMAKLSQLFPVSPTNFTLPLAAFALAVVLCVLYSVILVRGVKNEK